MNKNNSLRTRKWSAAVMLLMYAVGAAAGGSECGDSLIGPNESCDDGNSVAGDGCSARCQIENNYECSAPSIPLADNVIEDGDFESTGGGGPWFESTDQNQSVICNRELCTEPFGARRGAGWARLGSLEQSGFSLLAQVIDIPSSHRYLDFDFMAPVCDSVADYFEIVIDQVVVFSVLGDSALCGDPRYKRQVIDLETAPGGPYNDDSQHFVEVRAETFFETNGQSLFLVDNMRIGKQSAAPLPGRCELEDLTLRYDDFDPGVEGDLASLGLTTIELADPVPWGTTDDGVCGTGDVPPGNFTGGAGEAACLDANASGSADILSLFCTDAIDFSTILASELSFLLNVQLGQKSGGDFFSVLIGNQPPDPGTLGGYEVVYETFESVGQFAEPPGDEITIDISILDGEPEGFVCFLFSSETAFYAQVDNIDVSHMDCTDDDDEDKLQGCFDNCSERFNPDQTDSDGDDYGNACDTDISREFTSRVPAGNGNDCIVNFADLGLLRAAFFSSPGQENWNPDADFNNDQTVNIADLGVMKSFFFGVPGPSAGTSVCEQGP